MAALLLCAACPALTASAPANDERAARMDGTAPDSSIADGAHAVDTTTTTVPPTDTVDSASGGKGIFARLLDDFGRQATSPFSMTRAEAIAVGGRLLVETGLLLTDEWFDINAREVRRSNDWVDKASPIVTTLGGTAGFAGAGVFVGYSLLFGDAYDRRTSELLGEAIVTSAVWTRALKLVAGRRRPATFGDGDYRSGSKWMGLLQEIRNPDHRPPGWFDSFPSGHSTTAFAIATVFAERYNETPVVPVIAYTLATLVGLSRMTEHAHWASDVFAGGLIGYLCAKDVVVHGGEHPPHESSLMRTDAPRFSLGVRPLEGGGAALGLQIVLR